MIRQFLTMDPALPGEVVAVFSDGKGELTRVAVHSPEHHAKLAARSPTPIVFQQHRRARAEKMAPIEAEVFAMAEQQLAGKRVQKPRPVGKSVGKTSRKSVKNRKRR